MGSDSGAESASFSSPPWPSRESLASRMGSDSDDEAASELGGDASGGEADSGDASEAESRGSVVESEAAVFEPDEAPGGLPGPG